MYDEGIDIGALPIIIAISTTTVSNTTVLASGKYSIKTNVDCFIRCGASGIVATTSCFPLLQGEEELVRITRSNGFVAGITAAGTGSLYLMLVETH